MKHRTIVLPPDAPAWTRTLGTHPIRLTREAYPSHETRFVFPRGKTMDAKILLAGDVTESPVSVSEMLFLAGSLQTLGAKRLTLVAPWIAYGRQDRITPNGDLPLGIAVGDSLSHAFDTIITLDAHSETFIRSFRGRLRNILPWEHREIAAIVPRGTTLIVAPDHGAMQRARALSRILKIPFIVLEKKHTLHGTQTRLTNMSASIFGAKALIIDDMVDRGSTLIGAAELLRQNGASSVRAVVTHGIAGSPMLAKRPRGLDALTVLYDHISGKLHPLAQRLIASCLRR